MDAYLSDLLPVLEDDEGRHGSDGEPLRDGLEFVDVDFLLWWRVWGLDVRD